MCIFFQVEAPVPVAGAWGVATLDINADGIPDVVVADHTTNKITLLVSDGLGGFVTKTTFNTGTGPTAVVVGDFSGDDKQDVAVANEASNTVSVFINNGVGGFKAAVTVGVGNGPAALTTADVNGDHKTDIIAAASGGNSLWVMTNNGAGGFTRANYATGLNPVAVVAANLNADAKPDLIAADAGSGQISVLLNNGSGGFNKAVNYSVGTTGTAEPQALAVADLSGDNAMDVITANSDGTVSVLLGNGNGTFQAAWVNYVDSSPTADLTAITVADVTNDGSADILVADAGNDSIYVLGYSQHSLFGTTYAYTYVTATISLPAAVVAMTVADVNHDGRQDIVATLANGAVDVVLNQSDYAAAQAVAAFAANPALTDMAVSDTGANVTASLAGLEALAQAGVLVSVNVEGGVVSLTSQQFFADYAVLSELGLGSVTLSSGPLALNGFLQGTGSGVGLSGVLTNTGTLAASAAGGSLAIVPYVGAGSSAKFINAGLLTVGNGYDLTIDTAFINSGTVAINAATLRLGGAVGIGQLGSILNTGGIVDIAGTLTGPGKLAIGAGSALGTVRLQGTIATATIVDGGAGMAFIGDQPGRGGATLQNVTYDGTLWLNLSGDSVTLANSAKLFGAGGTGAGTVQLTGPNALLAVSNIPTLDNATINIGSHFLSSPAELYSKGAALTLGKHLSVVQVGASALLQSDRAIGDGIVNAGTITAAVTGGNFVVQGGNFTNLGGLLVGNGDMFTIQTDHEGNLAGGTLTGGTWEVDSGGTLWLPDDANVTTLAATLTLSGSGTIEWFSSATEANVLIWQTLGTVTAGGQLTLVNTGLPGTVSGGYSVLGSVLLNNSSLAGPVTIGSTGTLTGTDGSTVVGSIVNNGNVKATGIFDLAGPISGTGTLTVVNSTRLELGGSAPTTQTVVFATATGTLRLDAPSTAAVSISGFVQGDTIGLRNYVVTSDTYNATTGVLTINGSGLAGGGNGPVTLTFLGGGYTQASFKFATDHTGGTLLTDPPPKVAVAVAAVAHSPDLTPAASAPDLALAVAAAPQPAVFGAASDLADALPMHPVAGCWPHTG